MKTIGNILLYILFVTAFVSCGNNDGKYDATGTFEATEVIVSAEANGKIMQFDVTEGQRLTENQEIGYIDTVQLWLKKQQLLENIKSVNSRRSDIAKQIAATREQIAKQKYEKARFEALLESNAANRKQVDDIDAELLVLEKQLVAQISTLENGNQSIEGESAAIDVQVAQIEDQLQKSHITSPINGTILTKYAEQGELASVGKALFKIADIDNMFLRAYVTSDQLSDIKIGQNVTLIADYGKDNIKEYPGKITWIADESEFTPKNIQTKDERANLVYAVKIAVKNDGYIKIGMYGQVKLKP
ncbi:MAG: HlyD family efflux transporter periplasmic adaptor subunit [Bacteroidales bacterium]|nr:HlyD family efflux transporter periplasmic adaptor subunit [Bacteroidales bacterium]